MNSLPAMDWNAKWDWENLVMFNSKTMESHKKQPTDWVIEEEGEIDTGSFNLCWSGGGGSGSDLAHGSSARSSISASTGSSSKEAFHHFPGDFNRLRKSGVCIYTYFDTTTIYLLKFTL